MNRIYLYGINQKIMVTNLKEVMTKFADEAACRAYLVQQRWNGKPVCPYCGCDKSYIIEGGKRFKCGNKECYKKYSVTVGTVFEASNIPLSTWFAAMYILTAHKKGISSVQLAKDLGVTQKTAWFINHRIRESLKDKQSTLLTGTVEIDETYMSRKVGSKYVGLSQKMQEKIELENANKVSDKKGVAIGMKQRDGKIIVKAVSKATAKVVGDIVKANVAPDVQLMTDEARIYRTELAGFNRQSVNHSNREWVRGNVHTNGVENFWSVMKRGVYGIYHQISYRHLQRYCDEFTYRYNSRDMKDGERFELSLTNVQGRLKYVALIEKNKDGKGTKEGN